MNTCSVYKGSINERKTTGKILAAFQEDIEDKERTALIALKSNIVDKLEKIKEVDEKLQSIYEKKGTICLRLTVNQASNQGRNIFEY